MYYFKFPKLGSYLAIPLFFNSCLNEIAFDKGVEEMLIYNKRMDELLKERE